MPLIVITGTMGSGKTTVLGEASDILTVRGVAHAAIDLDTLGIGNVPESAWRELPCRNLASVWQNFAAAGATRLLLAEAVETADELDQIRLAVPRCEMIVCRLTASLTTMRQRVSRREPGMLGGQFVARVEELDAVLDHARLEHFSLTNDDDRSVTEIALELLTRAGWIQ